MRKVRVTLAVGGALILALGAVALTRSPPRILGTTWHGERAELHLVSSDFAVCQANETLPRGVTGIRLWMRAFFGAPVHLVAYSGSRVLTEGSRGADWTGQSVTVPVKPVDHASSHVKLCFALAPNREPVIMLGDLTPPREAAVVSQTGRIAQAAANRGPLLKGRVGIEYLTAGRRSWWSRILPVAQHMGLGRAFSGTWIALLPVALMAAVIALALRLTLRELP
ncbi:MAG: hypothetical protein ACRDLF_11760 [Solirubrobacteraceae bacterium]